MFNGSPIFKFTSPTLSGPVPDEDHRGVVLETYYVPNSSVSWRLYSHVHSADLFPQLNCQKGGGSKKQYCYQRKSQMMKIMLPSSIPKVSTVLEQDVD